MLSDKGQQEHLCPSLSNLNFCFDNSGPDVTHSVKYLDVTVLIDKSDEGGRFVISYHIMAIVTSGLQEDVRRQCGDSMA